MRILARTLAILAAALVVAGGTFALGRSSYAQSQFPARPAPGVEGSPAPAANDGAAFRGHDHQGGRSPSLFGAVEVFKNLAIVSIIVVVVSLARRAWRGRRPDTPTPST
jgi:uncharacterized protein with LGFP repeats